MPLQLSDEETKLLMMQNPKIITTYIKYVKDYGNKLTSVVPKKKYTACTESNVLQYFCEILAQKTKMKYLNPKEIMKLVDDMNKASESETWGTSQREWAINKICKLAGKQNIGKDDIKKARSWLTPEGAQLTKATMKAVANTSGKYLIRKFTDKGNLSAFTNKPTQQEQINHSGKFKLYQGKTITNIERKVCATCWICNKPIHVYNIKGTDANGNKFIHNIGCGQDEHVLPPGWGNIVGVLWGNLADQDKYNVNTAYSLAPSHAWCNQVKSDELFITLPRKGQWLFSINDNGIKRFKTKGVTWLKTGIGNTLDHDMFYLFLGSATPVVFMDSLEVNIIKHMDRLIDDLNKNIQKTAGKNYTTFMLRTTLCLVYIWVNYIIKNSTTIGGGGYGEDFEYLRNVPLNGINDDLLASTIFDYNSDTGEITVRSFYYTNKKFANNEASMICKIEDIVTKSASLYELNFDSMIDEIIPVQDRSIWQIEPTVDFEQDMGTLGYTVGLIIYHAYLAPDRKEPEMYRHSHSGSAHIRRRESAGDFSPTAVAAATDPDPPSSWNDKLLSFLDLRRLINIQGGAQKIGKKRGMITINENTINTKKHKSRKHKLRKSRKHKLRKSRKHKLH